MIRSLAAGLLTMAFLASGLGAGAQQPPAQPASPPPSAQPSAQPSPQPPALLRFTGQLLDVRNGYVYFTTGDAFKLVPAPRVADYDTGRPTTLLPAPKMFARAVLDPAAHEVVELDITTRRLAGDKTYADVKQYAVAKSSPIPAPEIVGQVITGRIVPVVFLVEVPPNTPLGADVYISTDASAWNPQAIKLDRVDGQHYRVVRRMASGTKFAFRVTRGSWSQEEVGQDGLEPKPHEFFVREVDAQVARATVYAWSDQKANQSAPQPGAIPTPFNPNPFPPGGIFPHPGPTPPGGYVTPRPGTPPNLPPH